MNLIQNRIPVYIMLLGKIKVEHTKYGRCWIWTGAVHAHGYGRCHTTKHKPAHRVSYEIFNCCKLAPGIHIHHKCKNKLCINPEHLQELTNAEHYKLTDMNKVWRDKTHCIRGHEFTQLNTYTYYNKKGNKIRACRECVRMRGKAYQRILATKRRYDAVPH